MKPMISAAVPRMDAWFSPELCGPGELPTSWDHGLVAVSVAIAVAGSYVALDFAVRMRAAPLHSARRWGLFLGGAGFMGLAIWSMHFVGMLALRLPVPLSYDGGLSLLSIAEAVGGAALAFWMLNRTRQTPLRLTVAGTAMGVAIASMHYTGMASMRMPAVTHYAPGLFALSILIAITASAAAMAIGRALRGAPRLLWWRKTGSALVMGAAIAGMHYVGMAAACYEPAPELGSLGPGQLTVGGVPLGLLLGIAGVIVAVAIIGLSAQAAVERERALGSYRKLAARLEAEVATRTSELRQANEALTTFSYSVAHDLRAPLRSLSGFSHLLAQSQGDRLDQTGRTYLGRIESSTQRMGHLIDGLLALAQVTRQGLEWTSVDLSQLAARILADHAAVEPDRRVETVIAPGLVVRGDAALLATALENLLGNAWKFTRRQAVGRIELGVRENAAPGGEPASINGHLRHSAGSGAAEPAREFFVRDNGAGFDMAHAARLFGVFERLHRADEFPGTGVGLATTKRILERHGGSIRAESAPGAGATFYFTLGPGPAEAGDEGAPSRRAADN